MVWVYCLLPNLTCTIWEFFSALCDIQFNLLTFGFGKKRCFDEFFFKSRCCCCVEEVLPHNHHSPAITPSTTTTTWEGLQSSSLLRPTITSNPFSISWAFKLAHEMPCVVAGPLSSTQPPPVEKLKCKSNRDDEGDLENSHRSTKN